MRASLIIARFLELVVMPNHIMQIWCGSSSTWCEQWHWKMMFTLLNIKLWNNCDPGSRLKSNHFAQKSKRQAPHDLCAHDVHVSAKLIAVQLRILLLQQFESAVAGLVIDKRDRGNVCKLTFIFSIFCSLIICTWTSVLNSSANAFTACLQSTAPHV